MHSPILRFIKSPRFWLAAAALVLTAQVLLFAQYQKAPPDFGESYTLPTPTHPEPRTGWVHILDIALLTTCLGLAAWIILKRRSRKGVLLLSIGALAYFGFYRNGCICPIGSIQNVTLSLVDPHYIVSLGVVAFFFLPLIAALLFGRVFCGGVCPLGAIQDLVVFWPKKVPQKLDRILIWIPYIYLTVAVLFAGLGSYLRLFGSGSVISRRFLICEWDPFVGLFRVSGPFYMLVIGAALLIMGMFIGRPYCRWLCPYGGILALLSRFAWKNVSITPDKELECGLCAESCPYGAIHKNRAARGACLACARCYDTCPRHLKSAAGLVGIEEIPQQDTGANAPE